MARSLSLATLRALRRGPSPGDPGGPHRPDGRLIWMHCPDAGQLPALAALAPGLKRDLGARMLITLDVETADPPADVICCVVPPDQALTARAFLDHWRPDLIIWTGGAFRPVLIAESDALQVPRILADAREDRIWVEGGGWWPGLTRAVIDRFAVGLAADADAAQRLRRAGMAADRITVTGPLTAPHPVPPCNDRERADLVQVLGPRAVWLAAGVPLSELGDVLTAAQIVLQRTHRVLLVLMPARPADVPDMAAAVRAAGLTVAVRSEGGEPVPEVEVYLADLPGEDGLWFRLSPLTYLGGSLRGGADLHPFDPAVLGSVVLFGPRAPAPAGQLAVVHAARAVRDGADLGAAVESLQSPDRAAQMAHAAWNATTAGADVAARIIAAAAAALDKV